MLTFWGGLQGSDRQVGRSGEIVCVRCSFRNTESFKIMEDLIRECVPNNTLPRNGYGT